MCMVKWSMTPSVRSLGMKLLNYYYFWVFIWVLRHLFFKQEMQGILYCTFLALNLHFFSSCSQNKNMYPCYHLSLSFWLLHIIYIHSLFCVVYHILSSEPRLHIFVQLNGMLQVADVARTLFSSLCSQSYSKPGIASTQRSFAHLGSRSCTSSSDKWEESVNAIGGCFSIWIRFRRIPWTEPTNYSIWRRDIQDHEFILEHRMYSCRPIFWS